MAIQWNIIYDPEMVRFQAAGVTAWIWILDAWIWRPVRRESILHVTLISVGLLLFRPNDTCVRLVVCCHRFSDEHQHIVHNEGGFSDAVVPWMSSRGCSSLQRHTRLVCWQRLLPRPRPRRLDPTKVIVLLYFFSKLYDFVCDFCLLSFSTVF